MTTRVVARLARMDRREIVWRGRAAARIAWDRLRMSRTPPSWHRRSLAEALAGGRALEPARTALARGHFDDAHHALVRHLVAAPQHFVLAPSDRTPLTNAIRERFPGAAADAAARASQIVRGRYDLLGYRALSFERAGAIDWHRDPVHGGEAPRGFWADVPYLDPSCGDHKIIWELNRHQHWLALGRAWWLTGDLRYRRRCLTELSSWMAANPPLAGINWASMLELGFRSISWLWALAFFVDPDATGDGPWTVDLLLALDLQLAQIARNLSYYFSPNTHLLGEALALYVCSRSLPVLRRAAAREALGRRVLLDEACRQIASDGGHCERSTHYHRYTLDFYLLALAVARVTGDPAAASFEGHVRRLAEAARLLADDRGELPQLGDDDGGMLFPMTGRAPLDVRDSLAIASILLDRPDLRIGDVPEEAYWWAGLKACTTAGLACSAGVQACPPALRSGALPETGYYISRSARGDHAVIDGGVHGYLNGGHAHADALSLTLTVAGIPLLVDPGTGAYTIDRALRDRLRSSHLHNTLVVDGRSQSIVNGPFSWLTMSRGVVRQWTTHEAVDYFEGAHDGYAPVEHCRRVLILPGDLMVVADLVSGGGTHTASVHWHVDRRWRVAVDEQVATFTTHDGWCQLAVPRGRIERFEADEDTGLGWRAPIYGRLEPSTSLRVSHAGAPPFWVVSVFGLDHDNPIVDVEFLPVRDEASEAAAAVRVVRTCSIDLVVFAPDVPPRTRNCWRAGDVESDARVCVCREHDGRAIDVIALDASRVRVATQPPFEFGAPHRVPHVVRTFRSARSASSGTPADRLRGLHYMESGSSSCAG